MTVTTIKQRHQLTIPRAIREKLHLGEGDQVEIREENGRIVIEPVKVVPANQAWFWTPGWQAKEKEADEDLAAGRVSEAFASPEAAIGALRKDVK